MEETIAEATNSAWDELGIAAALFFVLVLLIVGGYRLAMKYMDTYGAKKAEKGKNTPTPAEPRPTKTFWEGITKTAIAAERSRTDETQDERLNRIEERIDEAFKVEGKHRQELIDLIKDVRAEIKELDAKLEKHREYSQNKNEKQDNLINGLAQSFATLQGMIAAKRVGQSSGVTQFLPGSKPPDADK